MTDRTGLRIEHGACAAHGPRPCGRSRRATRNGSRSCRHGHALSHESSDISHLGRCQITPNWTHGRHSRDRSLNHCRAGRQLHSHTAGSGITPMTGRTPSAVERLTTSCINHHDLSRGCSPPSQARTHQCSQDELPEAGGLWVDRKSHEVTLFNSCSATIVQSPYEGFLILIPAPSHEVGIFPAQSNYLDQGELFQVVAGPSSRHSYIDKRSDRPVPGRRFLCGAPPCFSRPSSPS